MKQSGQYLKPGTEAETMEEHCFLLSLFYTIQEHLPGDSTTHSLQASLMEAVS